MASFDETIPLVGYCVIGTALATPYMLLAGWSWEHWLLFSLITPYMATYLLCCLTRSCDSKTWLWPIMIVVLPIFLNGTSKLVNLMGHATISDMLFEYRFTSMWLVVAVGILTLLMQSAIASAKEKLQHSPTD